MKIQNEEIDDLKGEIEGIKSNYSFIDEEMGVVWSDLSNYLGVEHHRY